MSAIGNSSDGSAGFIGTFGKLILLLFVAWIGITFITNSLHADQKHGGDAELIRANCDNGNVVFELINFLTGRTGQCVELKNPEDPDGAKYGIRILDGEQEITAFKKEKMNILDQVVRYLINRGYTP